MRNLAALFLSSVILFNTPMLLGCSQATESHEDQDDKNMAHIDALMSKSGPLMNQGRFEEALVIQEEALAFSEKKLGEGPYTALVLIGLGFIHANLGNYDQAETSYLRALAIFDAGWGDNTIQHVNVLNNLGLFYHNTNRSDKAEAYFIKAAEVVENVPDITEDKKQYYQGNLVNYYLDTGDQAKAAKARDKMR